jgi:hypothetical protein
MGRPQAWVIKMRMRVNTSTFFTKFLVQGVDVGVSLGTGVSVGMGDGV